MEGVRCFGLVPGGCVPDGERFPYLTFLFLDPLGRDPSLAAELDIEEAELIGCPCCHWGRESGAVLAAIRYRERVKAAFRKHAF
jgi:hypothetical protein